MASDHHLGGRATDKHPCQLIPAHSYHLSVNVIADKNSTTSIALTVAVRNQDKPTLSAHSSRYCSIRLRLLGIVTSRSVVRWPRPLVREMIALIAFSHATERGIKITRRCYISEGITQFKRFVMGQTNRPGSRALDHPHPPRYCATLSDGSHGALNQM